MRLRKVCRNAGTHRRIPPLTCFKAFATGGMEMITKVMTASAPRYPPWYIAEYAQGFIPFGAKEAKKITPDKVEQRNRPRTPAKYPI